MQQQRSYVISGLRRWVVYRIRGAQHIHTISCNVLQTLKKSVLVQ